MKSLSLRFVMFIFDLIGAVAWGIILGVVILEVMDALS